MVEREYCQTSIHVLPNHPQQDQKKFLYHALHTLFNALQRRVSSRSDWTHIHVYMYIYILYIIIYMTGKWMTWQDEQLLCLSASLHRMTLLLIYTCVSSPSLIALDRGSFKAGFGCGWCGGSTWGTLLSNIHRQQVEVSCVMYIQSYMLVHHGLDYWWVGCVVADLYMSS